MQPQDGRGGRTRLASLDFLGGLTEPRTRAERPTREFSRPVRPASHQEGADTSGAIWVMVDARARVASVEINRYWRERLGADEFPGALFEAYTVAVSRAQIATARAGRSRQPDRVRRQPPDSPAAKVSPAASAAETSPAGQSWPAPVDPGLDEQEWLRATESVLDSIDAELHRLSAAASRDDGTRWDGPDERMVSSPEGHLILRLRGRALVGITGDTRLIASAGIERLRIEALAAFRAAALSAGPTPAPAD